MRRGWLEALRFHAKELQFVIEDSEIKLLVLDGNVVNRLETIFQKFPNLLLITQGEVETIPSLEKIYAT